MRSSQQQRSPKRQVQFEELYMTQYQVHYSKCEHMVNTFVCTGHLLCSCSGVFNLAVVVQQECLLLLKELVNFL